MKTAESERTSKVHLLERSKVLVDIDTAAIRVYLGALTTTGANVSMNATTNFEATRVGEHRGVAFFLPQLIIP